MSPTSESSYESSGGSENSSTASDSESDSYSNYDDTLYSNGSEPSAMSSLEHFKVKCVKQKNVKKVKTMKRKKEDSKVVYDLGVDEMEVTPKKRRKLKKLRRV